jgi:hypothetical protein
MHTLGNICTLKLHKYLPLKSEIIINIVTDAHEIESNSSSLLLNYIIKIFVDTLLTTPDPSDHEVYQLSHSMKH